MSTLMCSVSTATVRSLCCLQLASAVPRCRTHDENALRQIADRARTGGHDILRAKGATNYGIGAVLTRIATAILRDEHAVLPVSTLVPKSMNLGEVSLSVLAIVGREGVQRVLPLRLNDAELLALKRSAQLLKRHIDELDLPA
jgi:L-lactate dehydrogenase